MTNRKIVIPGEVIEKGDDFLPGEGTEKQGNEILGTFLNYSQHIKRIIENSNLSIGYTPCVDYLWKNELTKEPVQVLGVKDPSKSLLLKPKNNPILNSKLDHVEKIREYLLNKYVKVDC